MRVAGFLRLFAAYTASPATFLGSKFHTKDGYILRVKLSKMAMHHGKCINNLPFATGEDRDTLKDVAWVREKS